MQFSNFVSGASMIAVATAACSTVRNQGQTSTCTAFDFFLKPVDLAGIHESEYDLIVKGTGVRAKTGVQAPLKFQFTDGNITVVGSGLSQQLYLEASHVSLLQFHQIRTEN